jgi:transglutaminase-like putative cysteine protease
MGMIYSGATNNELRRRWREHPERELIGTVMVLASSIVREQYVTEAWERWYRLAVKYASFDTFKYGVYDGYAQLLRAKYGADATAHIPNDWTMTDVELLAAEVVVLWELEGRTR